MPSLDDRRALAAELRAKVRRLATESARRRLQGGAEGLAELEAEARRLTHAADELDPVRTEPSPFARGDALEHWHARKGIRR